MIKKKGLGRGINNFVKDAEIVKEILNSESTSVEEINIDELHPNKNQARKIFDKEELKSLSDSIKEHGIIQPLIVSRSLNGYKIIAGERRYRAAKIAGLNSVPVIIKDISEEESDKISLIENIQRVNLNPIEEARGYKDILDKYSITQIELAKALGKSRQYIGNTVRMLKLHPQVVSFLEEGKLSPSHGKLLLGIKNEQEQLKKALDIIKKGDSVATANKKIKSNNNTRVDLYIESTKRNLEEHFGTKVEIKNTGKIRKIEIEYYTDEDLERITELIIGAYL